jgi:hypothetical protein
MQTALAFGRTYVIPVSPEKLFPPIPPGGFRSEDEIARLPGVRVINEICTASHFPELIRIVFFRGHIGT